MAQGVLARQKRWLEKKGVRITVPEVRRVLAHLLVSHWDAHQRVENARRQSQRNESARQGH
jgi:hypothetical protein